MVQHRRPDPTRRCAEHDRMRYCQRRDAERCPALATKTRFTSTSVRDYTRDEPTLVRRIHPQHPNTPAHSPPVQLRRSTRHTQLIDEPAGHRAQFVIVLTDRPEVAAGVVLQKKLLRQIRREVGVRKKFWLDRSGRIDELLQVMCAPDTNRLGSSRRCACRSP